MAYDPAPAAASADRDEPSPQAAPTRVERALFEAKCRGDYRGYVEILAATEIYVPVQPTSPEDAEENTRPVYSRDGRFPGKWLAAYTVGCVPPWAEDELYERLTLHNSLFLDEDREPVTLLVNGGTATRATLPAVPTDEAGSDWRDIVRGTPKSFLNGQLLTRRTGVLDGPLARGAAAGALLCIHNGTVWNEAVTHGFGYGNELACLRRWWGVSDHAGWHEQQQALLEENPADWVWLFVLRIRSEALAPHGFQNDPVMWRQITSDAARSHFGEGTVTESGVTPGMGVPKEQVEELAEVFRTVIGRIVRYENRMRADGVLAEDGWVGSVDAWYSGRASNMARWGVATRLCTVQEAEAAVLLAGHRAAEQYANWAEFGAGYVLGRCLHFDAEEFGPWYTDVVREFHLLMSEPDSPWLTVPLR